MLVSLCVIFFISSNIIILYIYFELSIFPILVIILAFGIQIEKINSSYYLIFYAALCSFPFLYVYFSSDFLIVFCYYSCFLSWELFFFLCLSFMIKFPVYFLHLWLPKAHVEAPTTARILLAGLLLKLGTAGFLRILGRFNFVYNNFWVLLSFFGMVLGSFCCVFQSDSKSLAAYSSVTHMSFLLFSLVLVSMIVKTSSIILMIAHGYTSTLMFYMIGEYYHVKGNRIIYFINSYFCCSVIFSIFFCLTFLSNSGVPPSLSFFSEFITISSSYLIFNSLFFLMFVYFFVSFYYSLFLITNGLVGKDYFNINIFGSGILFPFVFIIYNIFWLSVFF